MQFVQRQLTMNRNQRMLRFYLQFPYCSNSDRPKPTPTQVQKNLRKRKQFKWLVCKQDFIEIKTNNGNIATVTGHNHRMRISMSFYDLMPLNPYIPRLCSNLVALLGSAIFFNHPPIFGLFKTSLPRKQNAQTKSKCNRTWLKPGLEVKQWALVTTVAFGLKNHHENMPI